VAVGVVPPVVAVAVAVDVAVGAVPPQVRLTTAPPL
jgi:hypothetical protein